MLVHQVKYEDLNYNPHQHPGNIDQLTIARVADGKRILDIGCATGYIGDWLQKNKHCSVTGVEFSPVQAEAAGQRLTAVIVGNIEAQAVQAQIDAAGPFDIVMCSATIVCIVDPWSLLKRIQQWITPGGKLLITCANIVHWSNRRDVLLGRWNYQEYGLLDILAVRFFTVSSFRRSLEEAGYRITDFDAEFYDGGPRVLLIRQGWKRLEQWYVHRFAGFFAIQFMFEAAVA